MPKLPWTASEIPVEPDREYVVMTSFLPLKSLTSTVRFMLHVMAIRKQLRTTDGLIGYGLWAKPFSRRYWTLSVWESQEELNAFMSALPHREVMKDLRPRMSPTRFETWTALGSTGPPTWGEALARLSP